MSNTYFRFKQFTIHQERCAMKVCTDACLFGAWVADKIITLGITHSHILDIGTGTGLLSLMLAQATTGMIDAVELDEQAAEQAAGNIDASPWKQRCQVVQADARRVHLGRKYDLIISNPPFFENGPESIDTQRNLALHSSALSLEELLTVIKKQITDTGKFAILLPYHRKTLFKKLAADKGFYPEEELLVKQSPLHDYFRAMFVFGQSASPLITNTLIIHDKDQYTPAFTALLNPYYLNL